MFQSRLDRDLRHSEEAEPEVEADGLGAAWSSDPSPRAHMVVNIDIPDGPTRSTTPMPSPAIRYWRRSEGSYGPRLADTVPTASLARLTGGRVEAPTNRCGWRGRIYTKGTITKTKGFVAARGGARPKSR